MQLYLHPWAARPIQCSPVAWEEGPISNLTLLRCSREQAGWRRN